MNKYLATVRVGGQLVKTAVFADSNVHARLLLQYALGMNCVVNPPALTNENADDYTLLDEIITPKPPLTPEKSRINALKQNVERSRQQLQTERDRQRQQREAERKRNEQQRQSATL